MAVACLAVPEGCARHQAAASAAAGRAAIAAQPPLKACEARTFDAGGVPVSIAANADGTFGGFRVGEAPTPVQDQLVAAIRARFGPTRLDKRVHSRPGKWGLTVLVDACGRTLDLSGGSQ